MTLAAIDPGPTTVLPDPLRLGFHLFFVGFRVLFLELACIRWFATYAAFPKRPYNAVVASRVWLPGAPVISMVYSPFLVLCQAIAPALADRGSIRPTAI